MESESLLVEKMESRLKNAVVITVFVVAIVSSGFYLSNFGG
jgi:hypothetical protein